MGKGTLSGRSFGLGWLLVATLVCIGLYGATAQKQTQFETVCKGLYRSNFDCMSEPIPREAAYTTSKIGSTIEVDFGKKFFAFTSGGFSRNFYFDRADVIENTKGEVWILERVDGDFENVKWLLEFEDGQITSVKYGSSFFHRRVVSAANPPSAATPKTAKRG